MCQSLYATLGIEVDRSTVGRFLHRVGESIVWPRPQEPERVTTSGGGFEILAALALHLGWVAHTAEVIAHSLAVFGAAPPTARNESARTAKDAGPVGSRWPRTRAGTSAGSASPPWRRNGRTRTTRAWVCSK